MKKLASHSVLSLARCAAITSLLFSTITGCKSSDSKAPQSDLQSTFNSNFLVESGDRAKAFFYDLINKRNEALKAEGRDVKFIILDARDPRLYPAGAVIQPPTPAEKAIVRVDGESTLSVTALLIDRPGTLVVKEPRTGNMVIELNYEVSRVELRSRFDGLYASTIRNTSGNGWIYIHYLRGLGNNVTTQMYDQAVVNFLRNAVLYSTPLAGVAPNMETFIPR